MRPRWWAGWRENAIQQSEEMPRVRACDEEERADRQGRPAVEMPGLPVELDDAAAAAQAGADAGGVPFLAAGAVIPKGGGLRGRRPRPAQTNRMVLAHPPAHRPAGRQAPHGHGGRHVHGPRLVPDHRHRRANRRGAGPAVVRARVQGRIPDPVLPASRAGRAHRRRAARRGGGVHAGVAGNEDPALPGARAAQREDGPDVQARAPGRPRAEEAVRRAHLGRDGRAGRQVGRGPQRMARTVEGLHRRTHLRARRPVQPQGVEAPVVVDARGAATLLPAAGEAVPRGQAVRLSRAGTAEGRSGGAHHEPAGGRRQLGRQGRIAQPSRAARGAHAPRVRMGMLHEDRAPTTGVIHPRRPAEGRKGNDARTGRQRRARIRDRHRLERIPHHHAIPQHHRLTTKTSLKHHKSSYRPHMLVNDHMLEWVHENE